MAIDPQLIHDLENRLGKQALKVMFAGDDYEGQPYLIVTEDEIIIVGDSTQVVNVSPDFGTMLSGKISFSAMPDQISIGGGYWRFNPLLLSCVPSTTPTPIPTLVKADPELLRAKDDISGGLDFLTSFSDI
jgi:hypothetical protein